MNQSEKFTKEVKKKLKEKGAFAPCCRCGHVDFTLVDPIYRKYRISYLLDTPGSHPLAIIGCDHCGFIFSHSLHILGFSRQELE